MLGRVVDLAVQEFPMLRTWKRKRQDADEVVLMVLALAVEGLRRKKNNRRARSFLHRADLHPTPRAGTAWEAIYCAGNDQAFILTTGFDVASFHRLLAVYEQQWNTIPIARADVSTEGAPRPERRSLSACASLALVLHYLNSTMAEHSLQLIFAVTPSVCSRYLRFGLGLLLDALRHLRDAAISWPRQPAQFQRFAEMIRLRHQRLKRGFCFVDGLNLPVAASLDEEVENAQYNGWTCSHYCSSVFAFAPDGRIIYASLNAPGSWHDAAIARDLYDKLVNRTPPRFYAIADTAFPRNLSSIQGRIKTPVKSDDAYMKKLQVQGRMREYRAREAFNEQLVSARQAAEWGMRALQGSFGRLKLPLPADDHAHRRLVLEICCRLHQLRTTWVGINEIKNVYERVWCQNDDDALVYDQFSTMIFRDIAQNDRIARFYRIQQEVVDLESENDTDEE